MLRYSQYRNVDGGMFFYEKTVYGGTMKIERYAVSVRLFQGLLANHRFFSRSISQ